MLDQFVIVPLLALVPLVGGLLIARTARRTPARSIADPAWRVPAVIGGWAAVVFGVWVLLSVAYNSYQFSSVTPERIEEMVRKEMREQNGEEPQNLHLARAGWGRMTGTAEVRGRPVDVTAELVVEGGAVRMAWEQSPAAGR